MAVNPSSISLKGLYLDSATTTVGGERNIFSNGVMEACVFLRWSYDAKSEDKSTVNEIRQWLAGNGQMRISYDNHQDGGILEGWTYYLSEDNKSENNKKYVFDISVVVPAVDEGDGSQLPGNSVWNLACYLKPPVGQEMSTNVYFYWPGSSEHPELSTLNSALTSITTHTWSFNKDDFYLKSIGGENIWALEYNPGSIDISSGDFNQIYYLNKEWYQQSYIFPWVAQDSSYEQPFASAYLADEGGNTVLDNVFYIIGCRESKSTVALISNTPLDWSVINRKDSRPYDGVLINNQSHYTDANGSHYVLLRFYNFRKIEYNPDEANGPLIMWQREAYADFYESPTKNLGAIDVHPVIDNKDMTRQRCTDSFGQNIEFEIWWCNDNSNSVYDPYTWEITGADPV